MKRETKAEIAMTQRWGACRDNWPQKLTAAERNERLTKMLDAGLRSGHTGQSGSRHYNECVLIVEDVLRRSRRRATTGATPRGGKNG